MWRLHVYRQGDEWCEPERSAFDEVRADLERVAPDEDWVYIERRVDDGPWKEVAFAGEAAGLPDAWTYQPEPPPTGGS